jgi:hypothetical protein
MRHGAIRFSTLTIPAIMVIALLAPPEAEARSRHIDQHHHKRTDLGWNNSLRRSMAAEEVRPMAPAWSQGGEVCPGNARAIDCRIWPPPIVDDPDRRNGSGDGM